MNKKSIYINNIYFSSRDEEIVKKAWLEILDYYGLASKKDSISLHEIVTEKHSKLIILDCVENSSISVKLKFFENMFNININEVQAGNGKHKIDKFFQEKIDSKEQLQLRISNYLDKAIGVTALFVKFLADQEISNLANILYPDVSISNLPSKIGTLSILENPNQLDEHFFLLQANKKQDYNRFFDFSFPQIDISFYHLQKGSYLLERQIKWSREKRQESNKKVEQTLQKNNLEENLSPEEIIDYLETEIQKLSNVYSNLTSNTQLLREHKSSFDKQFKKLETLIKDELKDKKSDESLDMAFLAEARQTRAELITEEEQVDLSLERCQAAITLIHTMVDLLQSERNLDLQKQNKRLLNQTLNLQEEGVSLQVAATFIEFIIIFYYSTSLWEKLATAEKFHHIPAYQVFLTIALFDIGAIFLTHYIAKWLREKKAKTIALILSTSVCLGAFFLTIGLTYYHN